MTPTRAQREANRQHGIDVRTRQRRLANFRMQRIAERESESVREHRLHMLQALCGAIDAGQFAREDILDAEHALAQATPDNPQASLPFGARHATR